MNQKKRLNLFVASHRPSFRVFSPSDEGFGDAAHVAYRQACIFYEERLMGFYQPFHDEHFFGF